MNLYQARQKQLKSDLKPRGDRVNELLKMSGGDRDFYENIKSAGQEFRQRQQRQQDAEDAEETALERGWGSSRSKGASRFKY